MNKEIKQKWVEALRSGEYEQGTESLRRDGKYCCLGVLCDIHAYSLKKEWETDNDFYYSYDGASMYLPRAVFNWAGLTGRHPSVNGELLANLNDGGTPFTEIADLIEKHL